MPFFGQWAGPWRVVAVTPAKTADRTKLQELLVYCRKHRGNIRFMIVYQLSRFARDSHDHHVLRAHLATLGVGLRCATEPVQDDRAGRFVESILAAAAQLDNEMRADRVKAGMKAAVSHERWTFRAALGFLNSRDATGTAVLVPDPDRADLVREAFRMAAEGMTINEITARMKALGLRTRDGNHVHPQGWAKLLRKPIYKGMVEVAGWAPQKAAFEPLVSPDIWDRVGRPGAAKAQGRAPRSPAPRLPTSRACPLCLWQAADGIMVPGEDQAVCVLPLPRRLRHDSEGTARGRLPL